jgi:hypothetical protein
MCLDRLFDLSGAAPEGVGYKVFRVERLTKKRLRLFGDCKGRNIARARRRWIDERDCRGLDLTNTGDTIRIERSPGGSYPKGFHIFAGEDDAQAWMGRFGGSPSGTQAWMGGSPSGNRMIVFKVRYRKPVAYGVQGKVPVIVAREIYIY